MKSRIWFTGILIISLSVASTSSCRSLPAEYLRKPPPLKTIPAIKVQYQRSNWTLNLTKGLGIIADMDRSMVPWLIEPVHKNASESTSNGYVLNILIRKINLDLQVGWGVGGVAVTSILLLGFPVLAADYTVHLEGKLFYNNKPVALFLENSRKKKFMALYWGYGMEDAHKVAFLGAIHQAMLSIRQQTEAYVAAREVKK